LLSSSTATWKNQFFKSMTLKYSAFCSFLSTSSITGTGKQSTHIRRVPSLLFTRTIRLVKFNADGRMIPAANHSSMDVWFQQLTTRRSVLPHPSPRKFQFGLATDEKEQSHHHELELYWNLCYMVFCLIGFNHCQHFLWVLGRYIDFVNCITNITNTHLFWFLTSFLPGNLGRKLVSFGWQWEVELRDKVKSKQSRMSSSWTTTSLC